MLKRRLYYGIKPYVPWQVRMALRATLARRQRERYRDTWPIDEAAARPPEGWPGWPDGKQFAVVLTHDVEGPEGLERCQRLAELEMSLGYRSCFNFIPEGGYTTPPSLRTWLTDRGFEVGVHDLHHDGKLFASRRRFEFRAARINHYLREWGAVGFRSGFMLRNLDWIHEFEIEYDASTFDTDPFEFQAEGTRTIFPFWVLAPAAQRAAAREEGKGTRDKVEDVPPHSLTPSLPQSLSLSLRDGYVELPYTLPQDSTVFLLLREKTPDIWLTKTDWIAEHGGMVLINVHPDYMDLGGHRRPRREYPTAAYATLLRHLSSKHADRFWNPTPRQLTDWYKEIRRRPTSTSGAPQPRGNWGLPTALRGKRAAVLLYSYYPADPRPRRAAAAMVEAGMTVDLLCLSANNQEAWTEMVDGVRVFRYPMKRRRANKRIYLLQYSRFFWASFWFLLRRGVSGKYDVVHVHNMPDALVFAALIPRALGARIVLDLHDPMPELMMSIYGLSPGDWLVRLLRRLERQSIRFAHLVLTPNLAFKKIFVSRSCQSDKVEIVMNSPQREIFDPAHLTPALPTGGNRAAFHIMHHGLIAHRHGIDLLVEAVARIRPHVPGIRLDIYGGREPFLDTVLDTARRLGMSDIVHYHGLKTQAEIAQAILDSDLGVVPNRSSPFTEINFPTRIFEYLAMKRPVIAPATQGILDYFGPGQLLTFEPNNVEDLAAKILEVKSNPEVAGSYVARGMDVYQQHLWQEEKCRFLHRLAATLR